MNRIATSVAQQSALSIDSVGKEYVAANGSRTRALTPVDLTIGVGEFVSLVGPSGCGKTTLLKICAGLVGPTEGRVTVGAAGAPLRHGTYGMVFQSPALLEWRTALQNILLGADVLKLDKGAAKQRATELLELVQLGHAASKYPGELSGGMQQRVSIARPLLHDPDILFMDEPFGALDAMTRDDLNQHLQHVHQAESKTVLFVTHSIEEAVLLSDRVVVMSAGPGRVVADVPITLSRPRLPEVTMTEEFRKIEFEIRNMLDH